MTKTEREAEIERLERKYSGPDGRRERLDARGFLRKALHGDAIRWRRLTAPNAPSFDDKD